MYGEWLHVQSCMAKDPIYDDEYKNQKPVMEKMQSHNYHHLGDSLTNWNLCVLDVGQEQ